MVRTNECLCVRLSPVRVCVHEYIESLAHFIQTRLCHFLLSPAPYFPGLFIFSFHFNSTFSVVCRWCVCCYQRKRNFIVPKSVLCIFRIAALFQLVAQRTKKNTTHFIIIYKHNIFMKVSNISFTIRSTVLSLSFRVSHCLCLLILMPQVWYSAFLIIPRCWSKSHTLSPSAIQSLHCHRQQVKRNWISTKVFS